MIIVIRIMIIFPPIAAPCASRVTTVSSGVHKGGLSKGGLINNNNKKKKNNDNDNDNDNNNNNSNNVIIIIIIRIRIM